MKNKRIKFLAVFVFLIISLFAVSFSRAYASCSSQKPGFDCIDKNKVNSVSGCVTGLCPGSASVQCCSLASVSCKADGSSALQPCSANGNYGICNAAGECVDSNSGPIASSSTSNSQTGTTGGTGTGSNGTDFVNPLRFSDVDKFLSQILGALQKIIVTLSLLMVVYGAVLYVTSAGSKQIDTAKNAITSALVGLAIGIAAPSFLKEIAGILGWGTSDTRLANALSLTQIATNVLNFLLGILGILSLIMMVYGASMYLTSAGDGKKAEEGKNVFKYSIIGVILAMASMVLVSQVARLFIAS